MMDIIANHNHTIANLELHKEITPLVRLLPEEPLTVSPTEVTVHDAIFGESEMCVCDVYNYYVDLICFFP